MKPLATNTQPSIPSCNKYFNNCNFNQRNKLCVRACACVRVRARVCVCACMRVRARARVHVCVHACVRARARACVCDFCRRFLIVGATNLYLSALRCARVGACGSFKQTEHQNISYYEVLHEVL